MKRGRKELEDHLEEKDEWVTLVKRDCQVNVACPEHWHLWGHLGGEETKARLEVRVCPVPQALLEMLESLVTGDLQVSRVLMDLLVTPEERVNGGKKA